MAAISLGSPAHGQLSSYEAYLNALLPTEVLDFNNNLTSQGSVGSSFATNPADVSGFTSDLEGNPDSALLVGGTNDGVKTTTDVIAPIGSISFLFQVPNFDASKPEGFSGDRVLFDGGIDEGSDNDSFRLQWDNDRILNDLGTANDVGALTMRFGNTTFTIADSNIEATPGAWYYFGATWNKNNTSSSFGGEGRAVLGPVGGTTSVTALDPSNDSGSFIGDGGHFYIGNRGEGTTNVRPDFGDVPFRQSITGANPGGAFDNFAIWNDRDLSVGQLQLQFDALSGSLPTFSGPDNDTFNDGTRAVDPGGLAWYAADETSSGAPRPALTVEDDSAGIGSGNALFADVSSSNADVIAVLNSEASLGENLGDTLSVSFDFRLQTLPGGTNAELRFGLSEDTDNEFGTGGWGESDGNFDTTNPGAVGDRGVFARVGIDNTGAGVAAQIIETENFADNLGGSSNDGLNNDTAASADAGVFGVIDDTSVNRFELKLKRVLTNEDGENVEFTLSMDADADGTFESVLTGIDTDAEEVEGVPVHDANDGIAGDLAAQAIFDYFTIKTNIALDWVLDNFSIASGNEAIDGDFNGDGLVNAADYTVWRDNFGADELTLNGAGDDSGTVDIGDYNLWKSQFTAGLAPVAAVVPEPTAAGLAALVGLALASSRRRCLGLLA